MPDTPKPPLPEETLYIAPGNSQCRIYSLPYHCRPGQHPRDILPQFQADWKEIGLLNFQLKVVCLEPEYNHLKDDLEGLHGGTTVKLRNGQCLD